MRAIDKCVFAYMLYWVNITLYNLIWFWIKIAITNYITVFIFNMQYILNIAKKFEITPRKSSKSIQIITILLFLQYFAYIAFSMIYFRLIFN